VCWLLVVYNVMMDVMSNQANLSQSSSRNVLGTVLEPCCFDPLTGFYRDGHCHTGTDDRGVHVIAAIMTEAFLAFTKSQGNDLSSPKPMFGFAGLKAGDRWCLCAERWREALAAGVAPPILLKATHEAALRTIDLDVLEQHAYIPPA
jgi:uncharacterized protein (DUF2237 family)